MKEFNLLYFKNLLDIALSKFFDLYGRSFAKIDGKYVLAKAMNKGKLQQIIRELIVVELKKHIVEYDILKPRYFIIIGACMPKDNLMLKFKDGKYFPSKLQKLIDSDYQIKYVLKEKDIQFDLVTFNQICIEIFNDFFVKNKVDRILGKNYVKNVIFVTHKNMDCYMIFKTLKAILGKANCKNMYLEKFKDINIPIVAVNDMIEKYVHNKSGINNDNDFKFAMNEIKEFITAKVQFN